MPTRTTMDQLAVAAAKLNRKSEELNSVVEDFEEELEKAGVGVTVWLTALLDESPPQVDKNGRAYLEGWELGYAKIENKWRLAVRKVSRWASDRGEHRDSERPVVLAKAPRAIRIEAAASFEKLAVSITKRMLEYSKSIEEAKAIAKSGGAPPIDFEITVNGFVVRWTERGSEWCGDVLMKGAKMDKLIYDFKADALIAGKTFATESWRTKVVANTRAEIMKRKGI